MTPYIKLVLAVTLATVVAEAQESIDLSSVNAAAVGQRILFEKGILAENVKVSTSLDLIALGTKGGIELARLLNFPEVKRDGVEGAIFRNLTFDVLQINHTLQYSCLMYLKPATNNAYVFKCDVAVAGNPLTAIVSGNIK